MKKFVGAVGAGVLLAMGVAVPASAQYADPTTTSTTAPTTTTTTPAPDATIPRPSTTTTTAPPPAQVDARTSNPTPLPGQTVPISTPASTSGPTIDPTKPAAAVMVPAGANGADIAMPAPKVTQNANGTVTVEVTVPPSTPPGVYVIAVVGTTPSGESRVIIVPVVVRRATAQAASAPVADAPVAAVALPADTRATIAEIQDDIATAGGAEEVERLVLEEDATLDIDGAELLVNGRSIVPAEDDSNRPLVAAGAVALGGIGLVLLRRRTPAISRRTH